MLINGANPPAATWPWVRATALSLTTRGGGEWPACCRAGEGESTEEGGAAGDSSGVSRITAGPQEDSREVHSLFAGELHTYVHLHADDVNVCVCALWQSWYSTMNGETFNLAALICVCQSQAALLCPVFNVWDLLLTKSTEYVYSTCCCKSILQIKGGELRNKVTGVITPPMLHAKLRIEHKQPVWWAHCCNVLPIAQCQMETKRSKWISEPALYLLLIKIITHRQGRWLWTGLLLYSYNYVWLLDTKVWLESGVEYCGLATICMNRGKYICTKLAVNVVMVSKVVCLFQPSQSHCVKL